MSRYGSFALLALPGILASIAAAPGWRGLLGAALAAAMVAIAIADARRFVIPNPLVAAALGLAAIHAVVLDADPPLRALALAGLRGAVAAAGFYALMLAYEKLRGRPGLGLGDVKLAAVAGAWLDWIDIVVAIELAAVAALILQVLRSIALRRKLRATQAVPFGLYFAPAIWFAWLISTVWLGP